ncbi:MAG: fold metallo-hydrolase [Solirubrobacterales bacterium]|nr:fold metallo-hydrolase [Solirubrobacterales bacterium]
MHGSFKHVWRIVVPTPWPIGPVNAYVIDDDPLTLVDTGPASPEAMAAIEAGLAERGRRVEDLERIVLSHQHTDHWGMAATLVARSGAEICALEGFDGYMARYPDSLLAEDRFADDLLARHGASVAASGAAVYRGDLDFAAAVATDRPLRDGHVLEFAGGALRVLHRPGHSPSDTVFLDETRRLMLGADHVMAKRSVAIMAPPLDGGAVVQRPRALADYRASLGATEALDVDLVLPGHGEPVRDPHGTIAKRLRGYERMTARVGEAVDARPRTAIEIARRVRGGAVTDASAFFLLCDALGHLDDLLDAGAVTEINEGGLTRFAAA